MSLRFAEVTSGEFDEGQRRHARGLMRLGFLQAVERMALYSKHLNVSFDFVVAAVRIDCWCGCLIGLGLACCSVAVCCLTRVLSVSRARWRYFRSSIRHLPGVASFSVPLLHVCRQSRFVLHHRFAICLLTRFVVSSQDVLASVSDAKTSAAGGGKAAVTKHETLIHNVDKVLFQLGEKEKELRVSAQVHV